MPRLLWLADAARATGFPVMEVDGWQTRGSTSFNPRGLLYHHTAGPSSGDMPSLGILINGRSTLSGPLAQYGLGRSGRIYVVAAGRANHAGTGSWNSLSGNASVVGIEAEHTGKASDPWPAVQLDAYRKLAAEILIRLDTTTDFMCGHKEWAPTRKVDPVSLDMNDERTRVAALMGGEEMSETVLRLMVTEAIAKGWLQWPEEGTHWLLTAAYPNDPQWREKFEGWWNQWKTAEAEAIAASGGVNESRIRQLAVEAGSEVFVPKGKPVVIRGS